jgi:hypothetical protein
MGCRLEDNERRAQKLDWRMRWMVSPLPVAGEKRPTKAGGSGLQALACNLLILKLLRANSQLAKGDKFRLLVATILAEFGLYL